MKILIHGALVCGLALTLAACGGSNNDGGGGGSSAAQDSVGAGFQSAFNAGNSAEDGSAGGVAGAVDTTLATPRNPVTGDVNAISFTTDPIDIP